MGAAKRAERILQQIVASTLLIIHYVCIVSDRLEGGGGAVLRVVWVLELSPSLCK